MRIIKVLRLQKCGRGFLYPCLKFKRLQKGSLLGAYHNIITVYCNRICKWSKDCNCIESR